MSEISNYSYESWLAEFTRIAMEQGLDWLVPSEPSARRAAFDKGLTPEEELTALKEVAEWRGCGCGGG